MHLGKAWFPAQKTGCKCNVDREAFTRYDGVVKRSIFVLMGFVFLLGVFQFATFQTTQAGNAAYRMTLTIWAGGDEFPFLVELDERQFSKIENDPSGGIQSYLVQARRAYAEKVGYRKEIYGEENYKMVTIGRYTIIIRDISQDRIVFKKS